MNTVEISENKFSFSEAELLENIDEYTAHADEIAVLTEAEYHHSYCKRSTPFFQK